MLNFIHIHYNKYILTFQYVYTKNRLFTGGFIAYGRFMVRFNTSATLAKERSRINGTTYP